MISVSGKNWEEISLNKRLVQKIKIEHSLSLTTSKLIIDRGFSKREIHSLMNNLELYNPFFKKKDFISAAEILRKHINKRNKILIIGDYDVDGCTSTSLIVNFLNKFNVKNSYYIPDRIKDGYGANLNLIKRLIKDNLPKLVIMVDCGSSSNDTVDFLNKKNINSIIIDHHDINHPYPKSTSLINPKKNCDYKKYDYLCSAFLTYLLIDLYVKKNNLKLNISDQLIYVAIATIADVMPLREENRFVIKDVIENFDLNKNIFLKYLFKLNKINKKLDFDDVGFLIAPSINSAGRIDNANKVVELLTCNDELKIKKITANLFKFNEKRKKIENLIMEKIKYRKLINEKGVIFYYEPEIHEGIIGIIASKLKDILNKPVIVFTKSNNLIKGSARSIPSFNIGQFIHKALNNKILSTGGGHNLAAGLSLQKNNLNEFKIFLDGIYIKNKIKKKNKFFSKISFSSINMNFYKELNKFAPFGNQNTKIIFLIENIKIVNPTIIKGKFISCFVKSKMSKLVKAVSFNPIESPVSINLMSQKKEISILAHMSKNNWNNKSNIQLEIVDVISNNT